MCNKAINIALLLMNKFCMVICVKEVCATHISLDVKWWREISGGGLVKELDEGTFYLCCKQVTTRKCLRKGFVSAHISNSVKQWF